LIIHEISRQTKDPKPHRYNAVWGRFLTFL
jgi:hypothetical protein